MVGSSGSTVSIGAISKLPSGRTFVAVPGVKSLPAPLKSFDCFACAVHVAFIQAEASRLLTLTSTKTLERAGSVEGVSAFDVERNSTTFPLRKALQPVRLVVRAPGSTVTPTGAMKFADPSVCLLDASFVSVSLSRADVDDNVATFCTSTVALKTFFAG